MIKVENVSKFYSGGGNVAIGIQNVSCDLHKGEIVAIVGESGSGKSTFMNVVCGIDSFEEGEIYYDDVPVSGYTIAELEDFKKNHIGFIFQNYNIIDSFTVLQNVMLPLILRGKSRKEAKKSAKEIINSVGLSHRLHNRGTKLSGGEKQRCVIARALASNSDILACDEPTGNLDSKTGMDIINLIKKVSKDRLVLIVSHNYEEVMSIATREIKFYDGKIVEDKELVKQELTTEACLSSDDKYSFKLGSQLHLAFDNLVSTPKKTILSLAVFFAFAFFCAMFMKNLDRSGSLDLYDVTYINKAPNRVIAYDYSGNKLDYSKIEEKTKGTIVSNSFYEDMVISNKATNYYIDYLCLQGYLDTDSIKLLDGRLPENDNELLLGIASAHKDYAKVLYKSSFAGSINDEINIADYDIVGVYVYDGAAQASVGYLYGTDATNAKLKKAFLSQAVTLDFNLTGVSGFTYDETIPANTIQINTKYTNDYSSITPEDVSFKIYLDMYQIDLSQYTINFVPNSSSNSVRINPSIIDRFIEDNVFEVAVYSRSYTKNISRLENMGYVAFRPCAVGMTNPIEVVLDAIVLCAAIIGIGAGIMFLFIITFAILKWIYSSKDKTYAILRTLGASKKNLSRIVTWETLLLCVGATFLLLVIEVACLLVKTTFIPGFETYSIGTIILFILVMTFLAYLFARRFNSKLYKFTIQESLRKGLINND